MSPRFERTLKGLILVGLAIFLTNSIVNGTLLFYINRRFAWLAWIAAILLLFLAFAYQRGKGALQQHSEHAEGRHQHDHDRGGEKAWIPLALVALPLLLGILVPPRPLGARAVSVREANTDGVGLGNAEAVLTEDVAERNILDWLRAFNTASSPVVFDGQEATVIGFVYRDDAFPDDQFMVSRFVISCCVADATAVGLIVSWPGSPDLRLDSWVEVHGTFEWDQVDPQATLVLFADSVTLTTQPNQPYLYP